MAQIYEAFCRWLTLWLPEDSTMREHLNEASYDGFENEFWMAIAPEFPTNVPWSYNNFSEWRRSVTRSLTPMEKFRLYPEALTDDLPF